MFLIGLTLALPDDALEVGLGKADSRPMLADECRGGMTMDLARSRPVSEAVSPLARVTPDRFRRKPNTFCEGLRLLAPAPVASTWSLTSVGSVFTPDDCFRTYFRRSEKQHHVSENCMLGEIEGVGEIQR